MKKPFQLPVHFLFFLLFASCSKEESAVVQHFLTVEVTPVEGGSVTPSSGKYEDGEPVSLAATPSGEYIFKNWAGGASGTANPITTVMDSDKAVTAVFEKRQYPLSIEIEGEGTVKEEVLSNKAASNYPSGSSIQLTAVPENAWEFVEWIGDQTGSDNPVSISITETKKIKAKFQPVLYNQIIGKWDYNNSSGTTDDTCSVYSMVFNSDGTFALNLSSGEINGTFYFDSANSIVLKDQGMVEDLNIDDKVLNFHLMLDNLCTADGTAVEDEDYEEGECTSFLNCNDGKVWFSDTAEGSKFIRVTNDLGNIWIEQYTFDEGSHCMSETMTNQTHSMILVENNVNLMAYVLDNTPHGDVSVVVSITADDHLAVTYDYSNNALDETANYSLGKADGLNDYLNEYDECPPNTYVPDDNFERALIDLGLDDVLDDHVLTSTIEVVETLVIIDKGITDLTGIEDFTSLVHLQTSDAVLDHRLDENANQITSIDVSNNTKLQHLDLGENRLKSLDLSKNPELVYLEIQYNEIANLDLSSNPKLEELSAGFNQLKTIDISKNPALFNFQVFNNQLTHVDLSKNPKLTHVYVHNIPASYHNHRFVNSLSSLNLANNPDILELWIRNNKFSLLDLSKQKELRVLMADNNRLMRLDVSGNEKLYLVDTRNNTNLTCIQIADAQITEFHYWERDAHTSFSFNCSSLW